MPFGMPVEPDVYTMVARSSPFTRRSRSQNSSSLTPRPYSSSVFSAPKSMTYTSFSVLQRERTDSILSRCASFSANAIVTWEALKIVAT